MGTAWGVKGDQVKLTRMGGLGVAVAASLATIAAMLAPAVAQASTSGGSPAPAVRHYTGTVGLARLVPRHQPAAAKPGPQPAPRGARRLPSGHYNATEAVPGTPTAAAAAAPAAAAATRRAVVNFNGVSSRDSQFTNFNAKFEPPDQGLCKGGGFVLEPVNSAYRIYRTNGTSLRGPFNINDLFNVGAAEFTSDPRCWFDSRTQTWFATILFLNDTFTESSLLIAVRHNRTRAGCGRSTRSTRRTRPGTAARASATSRGSGSTRPTCTSPLTSSRSSGRSSMARRCGRSTSPTWSTAS
jgi:hypothetical protein